jgi:hypothetical protein
MSGALNSVMGGGGGGLLGAVGGIVGGMFGGPIGAMIGQALGNMVQDAIGDAMKDGVSQLQQEHGMPKFLADPLKQAIDEALAPLRQRVDAQAQDAAQEGFGGAVKGLKDDMQQEFVGEVVRQRANGSGEDEGDGSGGWLQAIAKAMGKTLGEKAGRLVELSDEMSNLNQKTGDTEQDKENANIFNQKMTEFQATSQEYSMLNSVFSTAVKALGEALSAMARKQ